MLDWRRERARRIARANETSQPRHIGPRGSVRVKIVLRAVARRLIRDRDRRATFERAGILGCLATTCAWSARVATRRDAPMPGDLLPRCRRCGGYFVRTIYCPDRRECYYCRPVPGVRRAA